MCQAPEWQLESWSIFKQKVSFFLSPSHLPLLLLRSYKNCHIYLMFSWRSNINAKFFIIIIIFNSFTATCDNSSLLQTA